jgi:hypothetical protein
MLKKLPSWKMKPVLWPSPHIWLSGEQGTNPRFTQIMPALSKDYKQLSATELAKYSSLSMPSGIGDVIESSLKTRQNRLINVMKEAVSSTSRSGWLIVWCSRWVWGCHAHLFHWEASTGDKSLRVLSWNWVGCTLGRAFVLSNLSRSLNVWFSFRAKICQTADAV